MERLIATLTEARLIGDVEVFRSSPRCVTIDPLGEDFMKSLIIAVRVDECLGAAGFRALTCNRTVGSRWSLA